MMGLLIGCVTAVVWIVGVAIVMLRLARRRNGPLLAMLGALQLAPIADAQVQIKACVPEYNTVASLVVVNSRRLAPPMTAPTTTPAGMQLAVLTPPPTRTPNTVVCGPDANTGYVEQTVPTLGGPGLALQFAAWSCSADQVCSDRSNVLLGPPVPLAAPTLR